jgi:hypothetical protein
MGETDSRRPLTGLIVEAIKGRGLDYGYAIAELPREKCLIRTDRWLIGAKACIFPSASIVPWFVTMV